MFKMEFHDKPLPKVYGYPEIVKRVNEYYEKMPGLTPDEIAASIATEMETIMHLYPVYRSLLAHPRMMQPNHLDFDLEHEYERITHHFGPDRSNVFSSQHQAWDNALSHYALESLRNTHVRAIPAEPLPPWIRELNITRHDRIDEALRRIDDKYGQGTSQANQYKHDLAHTFWKKLHGGDYEPLEAPKRVSTFKLSPGDPKTMTVPIQESIQPPRISEEEFRQRMAAFHGGQAPMQQPQMSASQHPRQIPQQQQMSAYQQQPQMQQQQQISAYQYQLQMQQQQQHGWEQQQQQHAWQLQQQYLRQQHELHLQQ
jgi:hypothetical protein